MRFVFKVPDEMGAKIRSYSESYGMTISSFIAISIANYIRSLEDKK